MMKKVVKVFKGSTGYTEIYDDWLMLSKRCATHFLHYPFWYGAELVSSPDKHSDVFFVAVYDGEKLVAVIPLERVKLEKYGLSLPVVELFYSNEMGVCDITAEIPLSDVVTDIQDALKKSTGFFLCIKTQGIPEHSLFDKKELTFGDSYKKHSHQSKYIEFPLGSEAFWSSYNSKFRRNLKRKLSKATSQGELRLVSENSKAKLPEAFEIFLSVEGSGWKGKDRTSIELQTDKLNYYQYLLKHYGQEGLCHINLLYLSEKCIAAQFSILVGQTLYLLKIGYDEGYADISPGHILLQKLVDYGCETNKFGRISFVTGVSWIDRWKPLKENINVSYFFSNGAVARMMRWFMTIRRKV